MEDFVTVLVRGTLRDHNDIGRMRDCHKKQGHRVARKHPLRADKTPNWKVKVCKLG
jgi:hypothetical protein